MDLSWFPGAGGDNSSQGLYLQEGEPGEHQEIDAEEDEDGDERDDLGGRAEPLQPPTVAPVMPPSIPQPPSSSVGDAHHQLNASLSEPFLESSRDFPIFPTSQATSTRSQQPTSQHQQQQRHLYSHAQHGQIQSDAQKRLQLQHDLAQGSHEHHQQHQGQHQQVRQSQGGESRLEASASKASSSSVAPRGVNVGGIPSNTYSTKAGYIGSVHPHHQKQQQQRFLKALEQEAQQQQQIQQQQQQQLKKRTAQGVATQGHEASQQQQQLRQASTHLHLHQVQMHLGHHSQRPSVQVLGGLPVYDRASLMPTSGAEAAAAERRELHPQSLERKLPREQRGIFDPNVGSVAGTDVTGTREVTGPGVQIKQEMDWDVEQKPSSSTLSPGPSPETSQHLLQQSRGGAMGVGVPMGSHLHQMGLGGMQQGVQAVKSDRGDDPEIKGDRRKRLRLARKAELARRSRKRKKDRIGQLRKHLQMLRQAILEEKQQQRLTQNCAFCSGKGAKADVKYVDMSSEKAEIDQLISSMERTEKLRFEQLIRGFSFLSPSSLPGQALGHHAFQQQQKSHTQALHQQQHQQHAGGSIWAPITLESEEGMSENPHGISSGAGVGGVEGANIESVYPVPPSSSSSSQQHTSSGMPQVQEPTTTAVLLASATSSSSPPTSATQVKQIFQNADSRNKRVWAHLESLGDCIGNIPIHQLQRLIPFLSPSLCPSLSLPLSLTVPFSFFFVLPLKVRTNYNYCRTKFDFRISELCPPVQFLAWSLGHSETQTTDPRGIWRRLWAGELGLENNKIREIEGMADLCSRICQTSSRLRDSLRMGCESFSVSSSRTPRATSQQSWLQQHQQHPQHQGIGSISTPSSLMQPESFDLRGSLRAAGAELGIGHQTTQSGAEAGLSSATTSSSLQALEIECLERLRRILRPIEMIRFCVWADQNRLTIAALDLK